MSGWIALAPRYCTYTAACAAAEELLAAGRRVRARFCGGGLHSGGPRVFAVEEYRGPAVVAPRRG